LEDWNTFDKTSITASAAKTYHYSF